MSQKSFVTLISAATVFAVVSGCGAKKAAEDLGSIAGSQLAGLTGSAFPSDLVITSPLASTKATSLNADDTTSAQDFATKKAERKDLLAATSVAACVFKLQAPTAPAKPSCYGPSLYYKAHPDFDASQQHGEHDPGADGDLPGGDLGMWDAAESTGEACTAAKMNYEMGTVASKVDMAMGGLAMMMCAATVSGEKLPDVDATLDLTENVKTALTGQDIGGTITAASISRLADDADGHAVYQSQLKVTPKEGPSLEVNLKHIALDSTNSTYKGKLWMVATPSASGTNNDPNGNKVAAISVLYNKSSSTSVKYSMRQGNFSTENATDAKMFEDNKDPKLPYSNDGYSWTLVDQNPDDGSGTVGYAWVAGTKMENVRSFVAKVEVDSSGKKTGTGYAGFGDTMENLLKDTTRKTFLDRMICNWAGPANNHSGVKAVQKQEMELVSTTGIFTATSSKIKFVPRNSCGAASDTDANGTFSYSKTQNGTYTNFDASNELVSTTDIADSLVPPAAPDEL